MSATLSEIRQGLVGTWKLVSYVSTPAGRSGPVNHPMGADVQGYIIYGEDGYMSAQLMTPSSKLYKDSENFLQASDDEASQAARNYLAYTGPYEVFELDGKPVVRHIMNLSLVPNWAGHDQLRRCELKGSSLTLGPTQPWRLNGVLVDQTLTWTKVGRQ
ncbi:hypothetical protein BO79DRAFT_206639 [Aspergillus costaricaensis CBS 115574]|uniref:Uncharacterized protein n=1 Tax=Aspergillus costaricaensis CBS 115574 TaxID=1448317 RepID=A0ACD1IU39_9EURO|nr:hypothetical protein BO79DRAFT_206639 [Aspergillus costaricaensis CBS 115574]RAK93771.1 hypothetical protein BO79DRAFT_206639 [Aspergillus costaricaensis CBS 115574]